MENSWKSNSCSFFLFYTRPRRMSGVQGGLGEHKRDILKLREALGNAGQWHHAADLMESFQASNLTKPHDSQEVNGLTVKSASHEVDIQKSLGSFGTGESAQRSAFLYIFSKRV